MKDINFKNGDCFSFNYRNEILLFRIIKIDIENEKLLCETLTESRLDDFFSRENEYTSFVYSWFLSENPRHDSESNARVIKNLGNNPLIEEV